MSRYYTTVRNHSDAIKYANGGKEGPNTYCERLGIAYYCYVSDVQRKKGPMTTKTINLYTFDELSDKAKDKARDWYREFESDTFGSYGELWEPYETAARLLGIEFKRHGVLLCGGSTRNDPCIWYTLHVQGAGASFDGTYSYAKGSVKAIRSEFPQATVLHGIADDLASVQKHYQYKLTADIKADSRYHSLRVEVDTLTSNRRTIEEAEQDYNTLKDAFKRFAHWIYRGIDEEYIYRMSDEVADETIRANEYTFTVDGKRENL